MVTQEELRLRYAHLPTSQLLYIIDNKFNYTETAVLVAIEEIAKRKVSEQEIEEYKKQVIAATEEAIQKNYLIGLSLLQKNLFYFIFIPLLNSAFKMNYRQDGYRLKLRQANYYSLCGFLGLIISAVLSVNFDLEDALSIAIWITAFVAAFTFEKRFIRSV